MAASTALSETLKSITVTKIKELEKQRSSFNARRHDILTAAEEGSPGPSIERLAQFHDGVSDMADGKHSNPVLGNIARWLDQARYDPSVPRARLKDIEALLRGRLDVAGRKLDLAHLYSGPLTEWIETPAVPEADVETLDGSDGSDAFEVVEDSHKARLGQLRNKFAKVVFEPLATDEVEIDNYLRDLFPGDHGGRTLNDLRDEISSSGENMLSETFRIDDQLLKWCIEALLKNQLLNEEKKASLNDFLKDESVLKEIRDVLNMRLRDLKEWQWDLGEAGMPVVPRQSLNGKWRVMMDEDVMQALLTHFVGTSWAVTMKRVLRNSRRHRQLWKQFTWLKYEEQAWRRYYLREGSRPPSVSQERLDTYDKDFFMPQLPNKFLDDVDGYNDDGETTSDSDKKSPKDVKQLLLRTLASETLLRRAFEGEAAVVQSDFQWFATGIAHSTVFAVMRFVGFPEAWIEFFRKVLEPPLNMLDGSPVRTRKRGLPMAHVIENLLGELVLYFMDLAVAQNDGMILYRFHDDLYLAGKPKQVADSWQTMVQFAKVMGLEFNTHKTGSVYFTNDEQARDPAITAALPSGDVAVNFLRLDPKSGQWEINRDHVQEHVAQLKKQLDGSRSVLQWIKTWNSCIGRFFSYTFGEPAFCWGKAHINAILATHTAMQLQLFPGTTVTEHVKSMIASHFPDAPTPIPDAFITMPESLGGLGLKNPFIAPLLIRNGMRNEDATPTAKLDRYLAEEQRKYNNDKKIFDSLSERERRKRYRDCFPEDEYGGKPPLSWSDAQTFMTLEQYTADRERTSYDLYLVYKNLLSQPKAVGVQMTASARHALEKLSYSPEGLNKGKGKDGLDPEVLWTVQAHEEELMRLFGGLEVVDRGVLPVGVLNALKARRVTWQMVL